MFENLDNFWKKDLKDRTGFSRWMNLKTGLFEW